MSTHVSIPDMDQHLVAGRAHPLLPEGSPGPVRMHGQWWAVPEGGEHYRPVTAGQASRLDAHAARLAHAQDQAGAR